MASEAKVLVIVPINDETEQINGCLDSILNSTLDRVEIVAASGYLHAEIKEKIVWYTGKYDRVHLISRGDLSEAINDAVQTIKSEYVFLMNIYDRLASNALEKYYEAASSNETDIVFGRVNIRREALTMTMDLLPFSEKPHPADDYLAGIANGRFKDEDKWSKMYASSLLKNCVDVFTKFEDTEFLTYVFSYAATFVYMDFIALERDQVHYENAIRDELDWTLPEDVTKKRLEGIEYCYSDGNSARIELISRVLIRQLNKYIINSRGEVAFEELRDKIEKGEESRKQAILDQERKELEEAKKKNKKTAWWVKWIIFAILAFRLAVKIYSMIQGLSG